MVQPDISIICNESKLDEKGCLGSPDLIIEIISPVSVSLDYVKKFVLYENYKVKEYWLVHPVDKTVMVFILNEDNQYGKPGIYTEEGRLKSKVLKDIALNLKQIFR